MKFLRRKQKPKWNPMNFEMRFSCLDKFEMNVYLILENHRKYATENAKPDSKFK